MKRHHRKLHHRYGRAASGLVDEHGVEDLDLYAENESALYPQKQAIIADLRKKLAAGKYDHSLAPKLWMYWVDAAAKRYREKDHGPTYNKATRMAVAQQLADHYRPDECEE